MSLFFDAEWFDAKLAARRLDRTALAIALGLEPGDLHRVFTNERAPSAEELNICASVLGADIIEVTLKSGVAAREPAAQSEDPTDRLAGIEARLDAIDSWLAEFETGKKSA
ncbi:MAG: hypothetical protein H7124_12830 [Phycisphaerales bacterium]|nr:hypothetical protein [Hyphomonadaceae bacterium]